MTKKEIVFLGSFLNTPPEYRDEHGNVLVEIALVGKSNVGKSSLINHFLNQKNIARVSQSPGKTETINLFKIDDSFILADLPGYGFAKKAQSIRKKWSHAIELYLKERESLKLILFLLDSRRLPSEEDVAFVEWAKHYQKPLLLIFTKSDTLSTHEMKKNKEAALSSLDLPSEDSLHYSIFDTHSRKILTEKLKGLWGK